MRQRLDVPEGYHLLHIYSHTDGSMVFIRWRQCASSPNTGFLSLNSTQHLHRFSCFMHSSRAASVYFTTTAKTKMYCRTHHHYTLDAPQTE